MLYEIGSICLQFVSAAAACRYIIECIQIKTICKGFCNDAWLLEANLMNNSQKFLFGISNVNTFLIIFVVNGFIEMLEQCEL